MFIYRVSILLLPLRRRRARAYGGIFCPNRPRWLLTRCCAHSAEAVTHSARTSMGLVARKARASGLVSRKTLAFLDSVLFTFSGRGGSQRTLSPAKLRGVGMRIVHEDCERIRPRVVFCEHSAREERTRLVERVAEEPEEKGVGARYLYAAYV